MSRYCKLIMITENNNNKVYIMEDEGGELVVKYGRVGNTLTTERYSLSMWDKKYKEKIKKGYKDVTDLVSEKIVTNVQSDFAEEKDRKVHAFIQKMKAYMNNLVQSTYKKAESATKAQVEEAQKVLDSLKTLDKTDVQAINAKLIELYTIIPRNMRHVKSHLLPEINLDGLIQREQDNLDTISAYISTLVPQNEEILEENKSYLSTINVEMEEATDHSDIKYILDQLKGYKSIFKVKKQKEEEIFEQMIATKANKTTRYLIHGTKCFSVIPIIEQGLKIRPTGNFSFAGKAYGDGNYFSEVANKSLNYVGYDSDKIFLIYEVHTGNPFIYEGWYTTNSFALCEKELLKRNFDSTYVKAGNGLLNSEIIVYNEKQCRLKYIIHM